VDVHHAELVVVTPDAAGGALPLCQAPVLLGLQHHLAGFVLEHVEGLVPRYRQEVLSGAGTRFFGLGDLTRLLEGDVTGLQRAAHIVGVSQALRGLHGLLGLTDRGPGHARKRGGIIDLSCQGRDPERDQPLSLGVARQQLPGPGHLQELGLEVRVRLLEQLDCLVDGSEFHACHYGEGLRQNGP
jgi:hypothetical protein